MNHTSRRELKIETPLAVLLTLAPWTYDQLGLPHSRLVGYVTGVVCIALVLRVLWISWATLAGAANITFKEASTLTWWRRQVIRYDIGAMHAYFSKLEIPVPDKIPPLTVHEGNQTIHTPPHTYRGELKIPRLEVENRKIVTHIYAVYVISKVISGPTESKAFWNSFPTNAHRLSEMTFFSTDLRRYFHASYWNSMKTDEAPPAAFILWKIRETLGSNFADRLASRVLRIATDSLAEISSPDFSVMFAKALKIADQTLEAYQQNWPRIQEILDDNPFEGGVRPYLVNGEVRTAIFCDRIPAPTKSQPE